MSLLDEFKFPTNLDAESQAFLSQAFQTTQVGQGVNSLQAAGHDKQGMAYRFFLHPVKSLAKSEEFDMEINDDIEMVQWFKDRDHKPVERVTELPKELLHLAKKKVADMNGIAKFEHILSYFDPETMTEKEDIASVVRAKGLTGKFICKGGLYAENYKRFQAGLGAQGLPLDRWNKITLAQVKTLESEGIFTLEQFASQPIEKIQGRFPKDLIKLFNEAVHEMNAQNRKADITPFANEVLAVRQENAKLKQTLEEVKLQMAGLVARKNPRRIKSVAKIEQEKFEEKLGE